MQRAATVHMDGSCGRWRSRTDRPNRSEWTYRSDWLGGTHWSNRNHGRDGFFWWSNRSNWANGRDWSGRWSDWSYRSNGREWSHRANRSDGGRNDRPNWSDRCWCNSGSANQQPAI